MGVLLSIIPLTFLSFFLLKLSTSTTLYSGSYDFFKGKCFENVVTGTVGKVSGKKCSVYENYDCVFMVPEKYCQVRII